jgi:hypothetical protein
MSPNRTPNSLFHVFVQIGKPANQKSGIARDDDGLFLGEFRGHDEAPTTMPVIWCLYILTVYDPGLGFEMMRPRRV